MLNLNEKIIAASIAIVSALLVILAASFLLPMPEYDYPYFATESECEAAGGEWISDDVYYDYCYTDYDPYTVKLAEHNLIYGGIILLIGIIAIAASLFLIKNSAISDGFLAGGGILLLFSAITNASHNPIFSIVILVILLAILIFIAVRKKQSPN